MHDEAGLGQRLVLVVEDRHGEVLDAGGRARLDELLQPLRHDEHVLDAVVAVDGQGVAFELGVEPEGRIGRPAVFEGLAVRHGPDGRDVLERGHDRAILDGAGLPVDEGRVHRVALLGGNPLR